MVCPDLRGRGLGGNGDRSEEHTSELQSLRHLVCRLLLEKKKKPNILAIIRLMGQKSRGTYRTTMDQPGDRGRIAVIRYHHKANNARRRPTDTSQQVRTGD